MKILLDTTIQIDKIFGSNNRIKEIREVLKDKELYSSTYVLGEYYNNMINDYLTLYSIFIQENDIEQTGYRITENVFGRHQSRMFKLFNKIAALCDYKIDLIKDILDEYINILINRFYDDIEIDLINGTKCNRANAKIIYQDGIPRLDTISCRKTDNKCDICLFWDNNKWILDKFLGEDIIHAELKEIASKGLKDFNELKGKNCWKMGDSIIATESKNILNTEDCAVCSSNKQDFEPICKTISIKLISPDYSNK